MRPAMKEEKIEEILIHIDRNILDTRPELLRWVKDRAGWSFNDLNTSFKRASGLTINSYIRKRKLYYAYLMKKEDPHKPNEVISGFIMCSGAVELCHSFKNEFGVNLTEALENPGIIKDNRLNSGIIHKEFVKLRAEQELLEAQKKEYEDED